MFYNLSIVDCGVNWQVFKKAEAKELAKGADADMKKVEVPKYDTKDAGFAELVKTMALTTTSIFTFQPPNEDVRMAISKRKKVSLSKVPKDPEPGGPGYDDYQKYKKELIDEEKAQNYLKRNVEGDASETGLVKFAQPVLMREYGGEYEDGIATCRETFPIVKSGEGEDQNPAMIPFSSDIKFNLIIRDMNTEVRQAESADTNISVFIKGAPEKVLTRCDKILVEGEELEYTESHKSAVQLANDTFGRMGERVLAFARHELDPAIYNKGETTTDSGYPFDVRTWKAWNDLKEYSANTVGWFPMW